MRTAARSAPRAATHPYRRARRRQDRAASRATHRSDRCAPLPCAPPSPAFVSDRRPALRFGLRGCSAQDSDEYLAATKWPCSRSLGHGDRFRSRVRPVVVRRPAQRSRVIGWRLFVSLLGFYCKWSETCSQFAMMLTARRDPPLWKCSRLALRGTPQNGTVIPQWIPRQLGEQALSPSIDKNTKFGRHPAIEISSCHHIVEL